VIGFDALLRAPLLKSPEFPNGRLQPYLRVGPALFVANANDSFNFDPSNQSDSDTSVGFKLGTGVAWLFTKNIGVFGEYRYLHFTPEFTFRDDGTTANVSTSINTHSLLVGVTFRF
jgi:opacity protein-like surface antigen